MVGLPVREASRLRALHQLTDGTARYVSRTNQSSPCFALCKSCNRHTAFHVWVLLCVLASIVVSFFGVNK